MGLDPDLVALEGLPAAQPPADVLRVYVCTRDTAGYVSAVVDDSLLWCEPGEQYELPDSAFPHDPGVEGVAHPAPIVPTDLQLIEG